MSNPPQIEPEITEESELSKNASVNGKVSSTATTQSYEPVNEPAGTTAPMFSPVSKDDEPLREQIVEVKPNDEIATIRERILWAEAPRVMLVVSRKNLAMREKMSLRLVQRTAMDQGIQLGIVAYHRDTIRIAREIGLPIFPSVKSGARKRSWNGLFPKFEETADGQELKVIKPTMPRVSRQYQLLGLAILAIFIGVMTAAVVYMAPVAQVLVAPISESVNVSLEVTADVSIKGVNSLLGVIPARSDEIPLDGVEQIVPVAKKAVPDKKSVGTVIFTNKTDQPVTIAKDTVVTTSAAEPIRFRTSNNADVPPRGRAEVVITATVAGPTGNVARFAINRIEGALATAVDVVNPNNLTGGTMAQVLTVSEEDKRRLEERLTQRLKQEALAKFRELLKEQEFIVPESISVKLESETFDKFVDEPADLLTLTAHALARAPIVNGADANIVALNKLKSKMRDGFELIPESIIYTPGAVLRVNAEKGTIVFEMKATGQAVAAIDHQFIANSIRGMTVKEAHIWLTQRLSLKRAPQIEVKQDWLASERLPYFAFRIQVEVSGE